MAAPAKFLIATAQGPQEETGQVALLNVGGKRHKFIIHDSTLSDYRSGYRVGSLNSIKIERMARISSYTRTTDRQAAEMLLARIVERVGLDKVQEQLAKQPTLNA